MNGLTLKSGFGVVSVLTRDKNWLSHNVIRTYTVDYGTRKVLLVIHCKPKYVSIL